MAHASEDMYSVFLIHQLRFSDTVASISLTVTYSCAFIGGIVGGHCSTFFGRRLTMIVLLIVGAALIPAYVLPKDITIIIGASLEQICIDAAYGIVPIHSLRTCTNTVSLACYWLCL